MRVSPPPQLLRSLRRKVRIAELVLLGWVLLFLGGCAREQDQPELLTLLDVVPAQVQGGDSIDVLGVQLPASDVSEAVVRFEGDLHRPGRPPERDRVIETRGARVTSDRVSIPVTEALLRRFCGSGDEAVHTTFRGRVVVTLPGARPDVIVYGSVGGEEGSVTLDVVPPRSRSAVEESRLEAGTDVLGHLGLAVGPMPHGGLAVREVVPGSEAERAGAQPGDELVSFDGVSVLTASDVVPSGTHRDAELIVLREGQHQAWMLSVEGIRADLARELLLPATFMGTALVLLLILCGPWSWMLTWFEQRLAARVRARRPKGATRASIGAWLGGLIASMTREHVPVSSADPMLLRAAPFVVLSTVSAMFAALPFAEQLTGHLDVGILLLVSLTAWTMAALLSGGAEASLPYHPLRSIRAIAMTVSFGLPVLLALASIVYWAGSTRLSDIVEMQAAGTVGLSADGTPVAGALWSYFGFRHPIPFLAFLAGFAVTLAESRSPDQGTRTNGRVLFFLFAQWAHVFILCGIGTAVFLGGWSIPGIAIEEQTHSPGLLAVGAALFLVKSWALLLFVLALRWAMPRLRFGALMRVCWRRLVPFSAGAFGLTLGWARLGQSHLIELAVGLSTLTICVVLAALIARRVRKNLRSHADAYHLSSFL